MIYLYYGENDFALQEKLRAVRTAFAKKHGAEAIEKIDGSEVDADDLAGKLVNVDLFSTQKLLVVTGASKKPTTWEKIANNLPRVPKTTDVVLVEKKPDGRLVATKTIKKIAKTSEFKALKTWEVSAWAKKVLQENKVEAGPAVVNKLLLLCGNDQWRIASEIRKLSGITKVLTSEILKKYVEPEVSADVFRVLELAFAREREAMNVELEKLRTKEAPDKFLALLAGQVFVLAALMYAGERSDVEVAKEVGVHPFVVQKMSDLAQRLDEKDVQILAQNLANVDAKMKLGGDGWSLLQILLSRI